MDTTFHFTSGEVVSIVMHNFFLNIFFPIVIKISQWDLGQITTLNFNTKRDEEVRFMAGNSLLSSIKCHTLILLMD